MTDLESPTAIRERYVRLRQVHRSLKKELFGQISKAAVEDCARTLGFWNNDAMVFDTEDDVPLLADFAVYQLGEAQAAITQRLTRTDLSADERTVLGAMLESWFTLFVIDEIVPGVGAQAVDVFSTEQFLLADVNLAETGGPGIALVSHLVPFETFVMTSGEPLDVDPELMKRLLVGMRTQGFSPRDMEGLSAVARVQLAVNLIGLARERREVVRPIMEASELGRGIEAWAPPAAMMTAARAVKVGRNELCVCGSGRKSKKCCGG